MAKSGGGGCTALVAILLLVSTLAVLSRPASAAAALSDDELSLNATATGGRLSTDFHALSCPSLVSLVSSNVQAALRNDATIAAGLLRIHFHDCFPQGCDASILLKGENSERDMKPPNFNLNEAAMNLIERIRARVHAACGPTVSCADITALATRDAVVWAGGPSYSVPLGQLDSLAPAASKYVALLPSSRIARVDLLHDAFCDKGLCDLADVVALTGGHTLGYAACPAFEDRADRADDTFSKELQQSCVRNTKWKQRLDVFSPYKFDNSFFLALGYGEGVLTSDMALVNDNRTLPIVREYAGSQISFFWQFARSMIKLSYAPKPEGDAGEIRRYSCFRTNRLSADNDDGSAGAASA